MSSSLKDDSYGSGMIFHDRHPHNIVVGKCSKLCWSQSRLTLQPFQRAFGAVFGYRQGFVMTASYRIEKSSGES